MSLPQHDHCQGPKLAAAPDSHLLGTKCLRRNANQGGGSCLVRNDTGHERLWQSAKLQFVLVLWMIYHAIAKFDPDDARRATEGRRRQPGMRPNTTRSRIRSVCRPRTSRTSARTKGAVIQCTPTARIRGDFFCSQRTTRTTYTEHAEKAYAHTDSPAYREGCCSQFGALKGAMIEGAVVVHKMGPMVLRFLQKTQYLDYWRNRSGTGAYADNAGIEGHADAYRRARKGNTQKLSYVQ